MATEIPQSHGEMMKLMGMTKEIYQVCGEELLRITSKYARQRQSYTEFEGSGDQMPCTTKSNPHKRPPKSGRHHRKDKMIL
jgi:hypothetical protein